MFLSWFTSAFDEGAARGTLSFKKYGGARGRELSAGGEGGGESGCLGSGGGGGRTLIHMAGWVRTAACSHRLESFLCPPVPSRPCARQRQPPAEGRRLMCAGGEATYPWSLRRSGGSGPVEPFAERSWIHLAGWARAAEPSPVGGRAAAHGERTELQAH